MFADRFVTTAGRVVAAIIGAGIVFGSVEVAQAAVVPDSGADSGGTRVTVDVPAQRYTQISPGVGFTIALAPDGTVWAWGANDDGELGDGTTTPSLYPVQVSGLGDHTIVAISAGQYHSLALDSDGTVWVWGNNDVGQLGNGTTASSTVPVQVPALAGKTITHISGGAWGSMVLASDGTVWSWGYNHDGQLGDGTVTNRDTPVQVVAGWGQRTITSVTMGYVNGLAIASDGTVWSWGTNLHGEIGDGTTDPRPTPVQVTPTWGSRTVTGLANRMRSTLAVASDGTLWGWGQNASGELGDGTTDSRLAPVQINGGWGNRAITSVQAGDASTVALVSDGTVWAWGDNSDGQLGDGTTAAHSVPEPVTAEWGERTIESISSSDLFAVARASDGTVWSWGLNDTGQLGDGTTTDRPLAVRTLDRFIVSGVSFDGLAGTGLSQPDPTHASVTTPPHAPGPVDVVISMKTHGEAAGPVTTLPGGYTYTTSAFAVTFDSQGGTAVAPQQVTVGSPAARPSDPTRTGYAFAGWFTAAAGGSQWDFATPIQEDTTLYAHWTPVPVGVPAGPVARASGSLADTGSDALFPALAGIGVAAAGLLILLTSGLVHRRRARSSSDRPKLS